MRRRISLWRSFGCAAAGIAYALRTQRSVRIHLAATIAVVALARVLGFRSTEWALLLLTIGLVWMAELINTAIEAAVDLISPDDHDLARIAKDTASGAVLFAAVVAVVVGAILFGPRFWALWR